MVEKVFCNPDAAGLKGRDSGCCAVPEEMRVDRLPERLAGTRSNNAIDRLVCQRGAFRSCPKTGMLGHTRKPRTNLAKVAFQKRDASFRDYGLGSSAGFR